MNASLPAGTVTFLLTDVEGSTKLWEEHPTAMGAAITRHDVLIADAVARHAGTLVKSRGEGDSAFAVFARPSDALAAGLDLQRALGVEPWPDAFAIRVRAALHTGEAAPREGDYFAPAVNRAARLRAIAHGGQTVLSQATADLVRDVPDIALKDLGMHRLKDLARAEHVYQLLHPDLPADFPPMRSLEAVEHNLPVQRTAFVGRERELEELRKQLENHRLVTLTGVGGSGKTRLAVQLAAEQTGDFRDGVHFVDLAPLSDPDAVPLAVGSALQLPPGLGAVRPIRDDLVAYLSGRQSLLLLDNCEHLVDACAELADELLAGCPDLRILATSREGLSVEGERVYSMPSLTLPENGDPAAADSVRLFVDRARAVRPGFALTSENADAVAQICRRLDGIPLAIEFAAAQVAHLSPRQIAERLHDRFRLLAGARRRVQRQQTLEATLDWSHDLLDDSERALFRRLAVFPGSFSLEAAEGVAAVDPGEARDVVRRLRSMVAKSLVMTEESQTDVRYRLLETVRMYGQERLLASGEADRTRTRHRDYFVDMVRGFLGESFFAADTVGKLTEEFDNLRAAMEWSAADGREDLLARLVVGTLGLTYEVVGYWEEYERWFAAALAAEARLSENDLLELLAAGGFSALTRFAPSDLHERVGRVIAMTEGRPCWPRALAFLVKAASQSIFENAEAKRMAEEGLEVARAMGDPFWIHALQGMLGEVLLVGGDIEGARTALEISVANADPRGGGYFSIAILGFSLALHLSGRHERALETARRGVEAGESGGLMRFFAAFALGLAQVGLGRLDEAAATLSVPLQRWGRLALPGLVGQTFTAFAAIAAGRGDFERGSRLLGAAAGSGPVARSPAGYAVYRHYVEQVREHLDVESANRCRDEGRAMTLEQAIAYALEDAR